MKNETEGVEPLEYCTYYYKGRRPGAFLKFVQMFLLYFKQINYGGWVVKWLTSVISPVVDKCKIVLIFTIVLISHSNELQIVGHS